MRTVIGLDPSLSGTGLVVLSDTGVLIEKATIGSEACGRTVAERMRRFAKLLRPVMSAVNLHRPAAVCIEGYSLGSNMPGMVDRVEYGGLLRWSLVAAHVKVYEVPPNSLKKWATGKGAGDKTPVIAHITQRYGVMLDNDNVYDAYALARIAMQIMQMEPPANQSQSEVVHVTVNGSEKKPRKSRKGK